MAEIIIYKAKDGRIELNVSLSEETVWLSLNQLADLFGRDKSVISRHLSNIFKNKELDRSSVIANFATTAVDGKTYQVDYYNLDAIISVGYRVNPIQATQFRLWATSVLKDHLIKGYSLNEKRLAERGHEKVILREQNNVLNKIVQSDLVKVVNFEAIDLIMSYTKTWQVLLAYDEDQLKLPEESKQSTLVLHYDVAIKAIQTLKSNLGARKEATALFGNEREHGLEGVLGNIEQTFGGESLYKTIEEKAAHLLYFVIKDHPFSDGNKRIGCLLFLLYLKLQNKVIKINDNGLVALALLIAESQPSQKNLMVRLVVNLLMD